MTWREAFHAVARMTLPDVAATAHVCTDHVLQKACAWRVRDPATFAETAALAGATLVPPVPLTALEDVAIRDALAYTQGNKMRAAAMLGINVKTLYNKLAAHREAV